MPSVGLMYHPDCQLHDTGPGHPERPQRLQSIVNGLADQGLLTETDFVEPAPANDTSLLRVHDVDHVKRVRMASQQAPATLDADTVVSSHTWHAALLAAGAMTQAVDQVMAETWDRAFVCCRPPGHHAERDRAMGFCLFNNVALAAAHLRATHGLDRVAIVDWDVHHGNGTQHIFEDDPSVFYTSLHQYPHYPGTGARDERGRGDGEGATLNCPMPMNSGDADWLKRMEAEILPALESFRPQFILVSAGFDAHVDDPLSATKVTEEGFASMTERMVELAGRVADGRLVSVLEGGYHLEALAASTVAHLEVLLRA